MLGKLFIIILMVGLLSVTFLVYNKSNEDVNETNDKEYSGPVRPTDNEEHFRKTGETITMEENN